jgi:hypothetical protein
LAEAWRELIEGGPELRGRLGQLARQRVEERYSLPSVVATYEELYLSLCREAGSQKPEDRRQNSDDGIQESILRLLNLDSCISLWSGGSIW